MNVDPGHQGCRHNLGNLYLNLERYPEAIEQYQHLVRRGGTYAITYGNLASATLAMGDIERGLEITSSFLKRNPESAAAHTAQGIMLLAANRPEEALRGFSQANLLDGADINPLVGLGVAQGMREDWPAVAEVAGRMVKSGDETARWSGAILNFNASLFRGRGAEALQWADRIVAAYSVRGQRTAQGHNSAANVHLAQQRADLAVKETQLAMEYAKGRANEPATLLLQARALSSAGRAADAAAAVATLTSLVDPLAPARDERTVNTARGLVALARGEAQTAIKPLEDAQAALTPRTSNPLAVTNHVLVWSSLEGTSNRRPAAWMRCHGLKRRPARASRANQSADPVQQLLFP